MALPKGWNPGDPCPACGSRVFDNRTNKKGAKSPDFRCGNNQCDSGNGRPWAAWVESGKQAPQQQTPAQRVQPSGANTAQQARPAPLDQDQFVTITNELTAVLFRSLIEIVLANKVDVSMCPNVLVEQVGMTVRQAWIEHERGVIRLGPEPPAPAQPESAYDRYARAIFNAGDQKTVAKLVMGIGGDSSLSGPEKEELANIAQARLETIAMGDQLPG